MAKGAEIIRGVAGAPGVAVVTVRIVNKDQTKMAQVQPGEVLVGERFEPEHDDYLKKAAALVTDLGGKLSHAAVAGKTYGIPTVVGTIEASQVLKDGQVVVVDGNDGAVFQYIAEPGVAPKASPLAERLEALASEKGIKLDPALLQKLRKGV